MKSVAISIKFVPKMGKTKKLWNKLFRDSDCVRCGGSKRNPSELCSRCNQEFQRYMKKNPLSNYMDSTVMEKDSKKRWENFIYGRL